MALIKLITCNSNFEADLIKSLLYDENIECFLTNEVASSMFPGGAGFLGSGINIMIEEEDFENAASILSRYNKTKIILCPVCNSKNIKVKYGNFKFQTLIAIVFTIFTFCPFNKLEIKYVCKDCNSEFQ